MSGDNHNQADETRSTITSATRHESAVTLGLSCGHAVLRRPTYTVPRDMLTDCEICAAERGRARGEVSS